MRKEGLSYSEINKTTHVARSTLSYWLRDISVISMAKKQILSERFLMQGKRLHEIRLVETRTIMGQAIEEIGTLSLRELKLLGAMLYWAEGTKSDKHEFVAISNSDPQFVQVTLQWLRVVCRVPDSKIRIQLHIHTDLDLQECINFWVGVTRLPPEQFTKPYVKRSSLGHRKKISYYGTVQIRVADRKLYRRIKGWMEGLKGVASAPIAQLDRAADF